MLIIKDYYALEYASGGCVVASSNLVTPTNRKALIIGRLSMLFAFYTVLATMAVDVTVDA